MPLAANLMSQRAAPASVVSDAAVTAAIELWAQSCGAESMSLSAPTLWRGLAVVSWAQHADDRQVGTTLRFAPEVSREAITASLGALAAKASFTTAQCTAPTARELRQSGDGWMLVGECPVAGAKYNPALC